MKSFILSWIVKKYGAASIVLDILAEQEDHIKFLRGFIKQNIDGYNLSKNPRKRISDTVMETRISA